MKNFIFEDQTISIPTAWEEVSVGMFITPEFLSGNVLGLLSVLSGIPMGKLATSTEDLSKHFMHIAKFMSKEPNGWNATEPPETIEFMGVECKVPKDLEKQMFGQKIMLGQAIKEHKFAYAAIPQAIAIYLMPQVSENWWEEIDKGAEEAKKLPIQAVHQVATFFLSLSKQVQKSGTPF